MLSFEQIDGDWHLKVNAWKRKWIIIWLINGLMSPSTGIVEQGLIMKGLFRAGEVRFLCPIDTLLLIRDFVLVTLHSSSCKSTSLPFYLITFHTSKDNDVN